MLARTSAVVGVLDERKPIRGMDLVRSSGSLALCIRAFNGRRQFCRSRGSVRRHDFRDFQIPVGTPCAHREIPWRWNSRSRCRLVVRVQATGSSVGEQEDGNRAEGDVQSREDENRVESQEDGNLADRSQENGNSAEGDLRSQHDGDKAVGDVQSQQEGTRAEGDVQKQVSTPENVSEIVIEVEQSDVLPAEPEDTAAGSKLKNRFVKFVDQLKEQQALYRQDVDFWGVGTSQIFTVYQDANNRVTKVEINEDEILRRSGLEPLLPQLDDAESRQEADLKLARAKVLAREVETGLRNPPKGSTIFEFRKERQVVDNASGAAGVLASRGGLTSLVGQAGDIVSRTPPWVRQTFFGLMFLYLFFLVWGARVLVSEELQKEQEAEKEREDRKKDSEDRQKDREDWLLKTRLSSSGNGERLNGSTSEEDGSGGSIVPDFDSPKGQIDAEAFRRFRPDIDKDEFRRKVEHIQAMARQARLSEKESSGPYTEDDGVSENVADDINDEVDDVQTKQPGGLRNGGLNWLSGDEVAGARDTAGVSKNVNGNSHGLDNSVEDKATDFGHCLSEDQLKSLANRLHAVHRLGAGTWSDCNKTSPGPALSNESGIGSGVLNYVSGIVAADGHISLEEKLEELAENKGEQEKMDTDAQSPNGAIISSLRSEAQNISFNQVEDGRGRPEPEVQAEGEELTTLSKAGNSRSPVGKLTGFQIPSRGSRPKVIISVEEARARIAARKAKRGESNPPATNLISSDEPVSQVNSIITGMEISASREGTEISATSSSLHDDPSSSLDGDSIEVQDCVQDEASKGKPRDFEGEDQVLRSSFSNKLREGGDRDRLSRLDALLQSVVDDLWQTTERLQGEIKPGEDGIALVAAEQNEAVAQSEKGAADEGTEEGTTQEEKEEMDWMRDDVLREIVFKVQANEKAGRDPFEGLNSEAEALFFRGLERKFEREGDDVKRWIEERVENLDYGKEKSVSRLQQPPDLSLLGPIGVDDAPEKYQLRWKDSAQQKRSKFAEKFNEERLRILQKAGAKVEPSTSSEPGKSNDDALPGSKDEDGERRGDGRASKGTSASSQPKIPKVESQLPDHTLKSPAPGKRTVVTAAGKPQEVKDANWQHTKRWSRELRQKYDMEKDPEAKALIKEIGQDLDRWITEDEIRQAEILLSRGVEGESEYVRRAYEKTKEKIKKQRETFGQEALVAKYKEYKPRKEDKLWWLDLPYVVCIGMERVRDGQLEEGIFSLDLSAGLEGTGKVGKAPHTIAFQDRTEATQFLYMMKSQSDPSLATAELVPVVPKELYTDAKADGSSVLVLKKGQLKMTPGQAFEDVEKMIVAIGCDKYWDEILRERSIDMDAVLEDGLGYGRPSSM